MVSSHLFLFIFSTNQPLLLVTNYHVKALVNDDKLTLLYKLEPGVCDKSFGIDVAKLANFPQGVIEDARRRIAQLEGNNQGEDSGGDGNRSLQTEGEKIISEFLTKLHGLQDAPDGELVESFTAIRKEFQQSDNSYVKSLIM